MGVKSRGRSERRRKYGECKGKGDEPRVPWAKGLAEYKASTTVAYVFNTTLRRNDIFGVSIWFS